ncbi:hypothetical protein V5799_002634 [Amblyomma americanum]|uniref:PDZ domain-containing protein n=1 Tax=Amblyomma americanum TaxID=6943 RepID=A0AAQ4DB92_AMBAM
MVDVEASTQRPLYTYSSPSFKKMINFAKKATGPVKLKDDFFDTSGAETEELDYKRHSDMDVHAGISAYSGTGASSDKSVTAKERIDVILFRTKSLGKYWSFGVNIVEVEGENNRRFFMVEVTNAQIVTPNKHLFPGDVLLMVDGVPAESMDQYGVRAALARGANEINITIAPMSPLRLKRPSFTRLHETVMTDANLPEPSAKAVIEPQRA